jgi:predicted hotdog family 3-hydroxylacyl-ACP dehydratase
MLVSGKDISSLIPQKPPMVMVDKLFECGSEKAVTGFTAKSDNVLVRDGHFSESGLIENMAQSSALMTGWLARNNHKGERKIEIGVIGGVKDFRLYHSPEAGTEISTEIRVLYKIGNASIVHGIVKINDNISAECELKIFTSGESVQ